MYSNTNEIIPFDSGELLDAIYNCITKQSIHLFIQFGFLSISFLPLNIASTSHHLKFIIFKDLSSCKVSRESAGISPLPKFGDAEYKSSLHDV